MTDQLVGGLAIGGVLGIMVGIFLESLKTISTEKIESGEEFIVGKASYKAVKTNELLTKEKK